MGHCPSQLLTLGLGPLGSWAPMVPGGESQRRGKVGTTDRLVPGGPGLAGVGGGQVVESGAVDTT